MKKIILFLCLSNLILAMSNKPFNFLLLPKEIQREIVYTLQDMKTTRIALKTFGNFLCASKKSLHLFSFEDRQRLRWQCIKRSKDELSILFRLIQDLKLRPEFKVILKTPVARKKIREIKELIREQLVLDEMARHSRIERVFAFGLPFLALNPREIREFGTVDQDY